MDTSKKYLVLTMSASSGIITEQYFADYPDMLLTSFRKDDLQSNVEQTQGLAAWGLFECKDDLYTFVDSDEALIEDRQELLDWVDALNGLFELSTIKIKLPELLKWLQTPEGLRVFSAFIETSLVSANNENKYAACIAGEHRYKLLGVIDGTFKVTKVQATSDNREIFVEVFLEIAGEQADTVEIVPLTATVTAYLDVYDDASVSDLKNWSVNLHTLSLKED